MSAIRDLYDKDLPDRIIWRGKVARDVNDQATRMAVVVPDFDPTFTWENCRWPSRGDFALPREGDDCIIILDNRREPWVLVWTPF